MNSKNTFYDLSRGSSDKQRLEWPDFRASRLQNHELQCHNLGFSQDQAIWTWLLLFDDFHCKFRSTYSHLILQKGGL